LYNGVAANGAVEAGAAGCIMLFSVGRVLLLSGRMLSNGDISTSALAPADIDDFVGAGGWRLCDSGLCLPAGVAVQQTLDTELTGRVDIGAEAVCCGRCSDVVARVELRSRSDAVVLVTAEVLTGEGLRCSGVSDL